jgi:hypothetical protein
MPFLPWLHCRYSVLRQLSGLDKGDDFTSNVGPVSIPSKGAMLCLDCDYITEYRSDRLCIKCAGGATMLLSVILGESKPAGKWGVDV